MIKPTFHPHVVPLSSSTAAMGRRFVEQHRAVEAYPPYPADPLSLAALLRQPCGWSAEAAHYVPGLLVQLSEWRASLSLIVMEGGQVREYYDCQNGLSCPPQEGDIILQRTDYYYHAVDDPDRYDGDGLFRAIAHAFPQHQLAGIQANIDYCRNLLADALEKRVESTPISQQRRTFPCAVFFNDAPQPTVTQPDLSSSLSFAGADTTDRSIPPTPSDTAAAVLPPFSPPHSPSSESLSLLQAALTPIEDIIFDNAATEDIASLFQSVIAMPMQPATMGSYQLTWMRARQLAVAIEQYRDNQWQRLDPNGFSLTFLTCENTTQLNELANLLLTWQQHYLIRSESSFSSPAESHFDMMAASTAENLSVQLSQTPFDAPFSSVIIQWENNIVSVALVKFFDNGEQAELTYIVNAPEHTHAHHAAAQTSQLRGLGSFCLKHLLHHLYQHTTVKQISATTITLESAALLEKAGFVPHERGAAPIYSSPLAPLDPDIASFEQLLTQIRTPGCWSEPQQIIVSHSITRLSSWPKDRYLALETAASSAKFGIISANSQPVRLKCHSTGHYVALLWDAQRKSWKTIPAPNDGDSFYRSILNALSLRERCDLLNSAPSTSHRITDESIYCLRELIRDFIVAHRMELLAMRLL